MCDVFAGVISRQVKPSKRAIFKLAGVAEAPLVTALYDR